MAVITFASNILSLNVQRHLGVATERFGTSSARLSSGSRINSASDDAAGLAIADSLHVATRKYSVANRNLNDALSSLNIMSNTLQSQGSVLTRLQELAEQAANGSLSNAQRSSLNREYQALVKEIGRIGETASFNGLNLLLANRAGSQDSFTFQAGVDGTLNSLLSISTVNSGSFSGIVNLGTTLFVAPSSVQTYGFDGSGATNSINAKYNNNIARATVVDTNGVTHEVLAAARRSAGGGSRFAIDVFINAAESDGAVSLDPNHWIYGGTNQISSDSSSGYLKLNGAPLTIAISDFAGGATASLSLELTGIIRSDDTTTYGPALGETTAIDFTGVEDATRALHALEVAKRRQTQLNSFLGTVGSFQSRLSTAIQNNSVAKENFAAAESRIRDVDVADETSNMVASKITQSVALSVLAQANRAPKLLLGLLYNT